jgi:DNA end-binding protein Ku
MAHASWKGSLRLSLVSVPVQAFNAASSVTGDVAYHQLHETCHSRIKYQKTCPIHGEVPNSEIVKGYEYAKGQYVIVDEDEIDALRGHSEQAVNIDKFVKPGSIDPAYFEGTTYYLVPDGDSALKPYAVLLEALKAKSLWGLAIATFSRREHLVVLRGAENALCMEILHYTSELRAPSDVLGDVELPAVGREEARLAAMLIDASTSKSVDLSRYTDDYNDQLRALLDAKIEGREIVAPPEEEHAPSINLMDALKKSLARTKPGTGKRIVHERLRPTHRPRTSRRKSAG